MIVLYVSDNPLFCIKSIKQSKYYNYFIEMKKAYLLLLAGMLSTVTYADNNQTVKIEGSIIDKVVTEITFDGDEVVLHYSDNSSDTKDMSLVAFSFTYGETAGVHHVENAKKTWNGKIYNLNGQLVGTSIEGLPKGVYVINGQKVIIK